MKIPIAAPEETVFEIRPPRKDWEEAFRTMAEAGDDALLDGETSTTTEWDTDEWQWP